MERSFIVTKESKYLKDVEKYYELGEQQREFVKKFFTEKGIESTGYIVGGNGFVNAPFNEVSKDSIKLSIEPLENDLIKFGKMLTKPNKNNGTCSFRKNSVIGKEFAQRCVDEKIIINLFKPRPGEYFNSVGFYGCSYSQFSYNDKLYLKITSDYLKVDDKPEGFIEIKLSEYYKAVEEYEKINPND